MFSIIETLATAILLILVMIFILHLLSGDAGEWLASKFSVQDSTSISKHMGFHSTNQTSTTGTGTAFA